MSAAAEKAQAVTPMKDIPVVNINVPDYPDREPRGAGALSRGPFKPTQSSKQGLAAPAMADISSSGRVLVINFNFRIFLLSLSVSISLAIPSSPSIFSLSSSRSGAQQKKHHKNDDKFSIFIQLFFCTIFLSCTSSSSLSLARFPAHGKILTADFSVAFKYTSSHSSLPRILKKYFFLSRFYLQNYDFFPSAL